ncbi:hypothetical protein [Desnuesiella massiliensis]|uniref:hypothetical protein n=1 Tax=Desnuesiella massiliensis TaxID=1650662 RepID=UPI0018A86296|nr:hypothetical protein [Desnuesiella massiliensis]
MHIIEEANRKFYYISKNKRFELTRNSANPIIDISKLEHYTFIIISSRKMKLPTFYFVAIPNTLFESEELYNKFVNSISD